MKWSRKHAYLHVQREGQQNTLNQEARWLLRNLTWDMFAGNDVGVRFLTSGDCDTVWASQPSLQTPSCRVDWGATRQGFLAKLVAVLGLGPAKDKLPATSIIGIWRIFISFVITLTIW